jgi:hypothetical protein
MRPVHLLHNMSVPPRSTVTVRRAKLPAVRYLVDGEFLDGPDWKPFRSEGATALLRTLKPRTLRSLSKATGMTWPGDPTQLFERWMTWALSRAAVPDRVGVFVSDGEDGLGARPLPDDAVLAVLARRSGPLYLPRRQFAASLMAPARLVLLFPEA